MTRTIVVGILSCCLALGVSACSQPKAEGCVTDADCDQNQFCKDSACLCRTDDACKAGEYCNPYGGCQVRPPCLGNQDCATGEICSYTVESGGACIPATQCAASTQCPFNNYCLKPSPGQLGTCASGCRDSSDCQLGFVCTGGNCVDAATSTACTLCPSQPQPDASYCEYLKICSLSGQCQSGPNAASLCQTCDSSPGSCPNGMQCLADEELPGQAYCAPECNSNADCPNGFGGCGGVSVYFWECTGTNVCPNGAPCNHDLETNRSFCGCSTNQHCNPCSAICLDGSATCTSDANCPGSMCSSALGMKYCLSDDSGATCTSDADCPVIFPCENGYCRTDWLACGKDQGALCSDLRNAATSPCRQY